MRAAYSERDIRLRDRDQLFPPTCRRAETTQIAAE
jgi:hypothetical protein